VPDVPYISLGLDVDQDVIVGNALDYLIDNIPNYEAHEGQLDVWLVRVLARMVSETALVASQVPPLIFSYFGRSVLGIPSTEAARARASSTWTIRDALGHTIPAGTVVAYPVSSELSVLFSVENPVVVPPGFTTTADGEVTLVAVEEGAAGNGLAPGVVDLVDAYAWVDQITVTTVTSGGADAESESTYLDRLAAELRLLAGRPIKPDDFATLALRKPGVARAKAIDLYNPSTNTYDNPRMVSVAVADSEGNPVSSGVRADVQSYLDGLREVNFVVHTIDPTYHDINVTATVTAFAGADVDAVGDACVAAVEEYLSPSTWLWAKTVRYNELVALLSNVEGVDFVDILSSPASDVILSGAAPLARAGQVLITVLAQ